jgi:hypothetical protein
VLDSVFSTLYNSGETVTVSTFLLLLAAALLLGAVYALIYQRFHPCTRSFAVTLATLPAVVAVVILMVNGSIGAGIAVAGAFSLVRFRSAPGTGREISAVFTVMAIGLACGMGCPALAGLFTLILGAVSSLYARFGFGAGRGGELRRLLHITMPEGLEYAGIFDDLFAEYTSEAKLLRVKTANLGSLNRLTYEILLKKNGGEKALIDGLRCRNGNLEISLSVQADDPTEL